jgi:hypothetical protein
MSIVNEARLHRSLAKQIVVPKLDGRFDASVWARIDAEAKRAAAPVRQLSASSRWMFRVNLIGAAVAVSLVLFFGAQALSGIEVGFTMPEISAATVERLVKALTWPMTGLAVLTGLMFTPIGRRLRAEFS